MNDTERTQLIEGLRRPITGRSLVDGLQALQGLAADAIEELLQVKNGAYRELNKVVALAACLALDAGVPACRRTWATTTPDPAWAGWCNVVYIMLPTGQVSWHIADEEVETFRSFLGTLAFDRGGPYGDMVALMRSQRNQMGGLLGRALKRAGVLHEDVAGATGPELVAAAETWLDGPREHTTLRGEKG